MLNKSASTIVKDGGEVNGLCYLPMCTNFDPTYYLLDKSLHSRLVPSASDIKPDNRLKIIAESTSCRTILETSTNGIHDQTVAVLSKCFDRCGYSLFQSNARTTLATKDLSVGMCNGSTFEDIHVHIRDFFIAVCEIKGSEASVLPALLQAMLTATHFCIGLYNKGIERSECIVPVVANTGLIMTFGATILLADSCPTYIPLSKQLDLTNDAENALAFAYLKKVVDHCERLVTLPTNVPKIRISAMKLCATNNFYIKTIDENVFGKGFGMFVDNESQDIMPGLYNMISCLNCVYKYEPSRPFAEYPIALRTPDSTIQEKKPGYSRYFELIYRDLTALGYQIGIPARLIQDDSTCTTSASLQYILNPEFDLFLKKLRVAVKAIKEAGVVHVDLYASNIMWKRVEDDVDIKIIDWDVSHRICEKTFNERFRSAIMNRFRYVCALENHDALYLSVYEWSPEDNQSDWNALASGNKIAMDGSFTNLLLIRVTALCQQTAT